MKQLLIILTTTLILLGTAFAQPNAKNLKPKDDSIVWHTSKDDVIALAKSEGKKVLLIAGRETCGNTNYMKNYICEMTSPQIKSYIEQHYIPWFCDVDSDGTFWQYAADFTSGITLPLICMIDPDDSDHYIDRSTATQSEDIFYNRLQMAIVEPDATLSVTPSEIEISELSGTTSIAIANTNTGTMNWEVIEYEDWLSVTPDSGTNDLTITVSYEANRFISRTAIITISADYARNSPFYVTVVQASGPDVLKWYTSKDEAINLAKNEGKKILLLAGREICGNTRYMRNNVCEKTSPEIKQYIQTHYIPWYSDVDNSYEYGAYAQGLERFTLPLICIIDPLDSDNYLDRTTATQTPEEFFERLNNYSKTTPLPADFNNNSVYDLQDLIISLQICTKSQLLSKPYVDAAINGNSKIALPESIFVLQKLSESD
jgi:thioredoxin-related protein